MERVVLPGGGEAVKWAVAARPPAGGDAPTVDLWAMSLDGATGDEGLLSADERERAGRFAAPEPRRRYVGARARLRRVLSLYLGLPPGEIVFRYGPQGKPFVLPSGPEEAPRFNLSHSGDRLLVAVARGAEVGVDLERIAPGFPASEVAARFLAPEEAGALEGLPADQQLSEFFHLWARKEAVLKGLGTGLSGSPADIRFTPDDGHWAVRPSGTLAASLGRWSVRDLTCWEGYAAAVAIEDPL